MSKIQNRREFLGAAACTGSCLLLGSFVPRAGAAPAKAEGEKTYDFDTLAYCCYECRPERCPIGKASLSNDLEEKKKIAVKWREKHGREFSAEEVFCFGCKVEPAKMGFNVKSCDVRACVLAKGIVSCAHCRDLEDCRRSLWINYPKFRDHVLAIQKNVLG
jgi:hypothetical protein